MNKRKEYSDRIDKLESDRYKMLNENTKFYNDVDELNEKRDKTVMIGIPFTLAGMSLITLGLYRITNNPNIVATFAALTGCSVCGLSFHDLKLSLKISKINKIIKNNELKLDRNEYELEFAKQLLESYERLNSICNEEIKTNKSNLIRNNNLVNSIVNTKGKVRSLSYKKANNIRK